MESIKLTRKLLSKYKFANNQTPNLFEDFEHSDILTKDYSDGEIELGLIWCWNGEDRTKGMLFRFEIIDKEKPCSMCGHSYIEHSRKSHFCKYSGCDCKDFTQDKLGDFK